MPNKKVALKSRSARLVDIGEGLYRLIPSGELAVALCTGEGLLSGVWRALAGVFARIQRRVIMSYECVHGAGDAQAEQRTAGSAHTGTSWASSGAVPEVGLDLAGCRAEW